MEIKLDEKTIQGIVGEALLQSLTQENKEILIKGAISHLLSKTGSNFNAPSVLQQAFNGAVRNIAEKMALEHLTNNEELETAIKGMLAEAITMLTVTNREKTIQQLSETIAKGITGPDRY